MCVNPKCQGVNCSRIFHFASSLKEGGRVRRCKSSRAKKQNSGSFWLLNLREMQKDTYILKKEKRSSDFEITLTKFTNF